MTARIPVAAPARTMAGIRAKRRHPEQVLQTAIVDALRAIMLPPALVTSFPAGGGGRIRGAIIKGMGYVGGMPDLVLFHGGRAWGLEVKTAVGRLSDAQRETHAALAAAGIPVAVVRSVDHAIAYIVAWGIPTRITEAERCRFIREIAV